MATNARKPMGGVSRRCARLGVLAAFLVLCASIAALVLVPRYSQPVAVADVGTTAPDFELHDTRRHTINLTGCRGQAVVLFFCSTHPTLGEDYAPRVQQLAHEYASDDRVQFLAIAPQGDDAMDRTFPTLLDEQGAVASRYSAFPKPFLVVIDPRGQVRYRGPFDDNHDAAFVTQNFCAEAMRQVLGAPGDAVASLRK